MGAHACAHAAAPLSVATLWTMRIDVIKSTDLITGGRKADGKARQGLKRFYIKERTKGKINKEELLLKAKDARADGHWKYVAMGRFEYLNKTSEIMRGQCAPACLTRTDMRLCMLVRIH